MAMAGERADAQGRDDGPAVGIRALKQNASEVVARVRKGSALTITDRGVPVARIVPIQPTPLDDLIASGALEPARLSMSELWARRAGWQRTAPPGKELAGGSALSTDDILTELRAERL
ncbi:type II toxin-antitoxin system Phd/YefM family antitoxin [Leucobacter aridicollis]|uniref:type II toxin-antitoxin system Phd/YefM family antitoxin n=1 Tax=Leucobacter aridicollis TaxID=283878 RepID=UPI002167D81D|nr:type II toxin-antitoxin system prevent-host-death family antitoxin [Leucobacter aridicollis]MCS3428020.1 prevent-host-death family protein [Leucobacter aridicollis]